MNIQTYFYQNTASPVSERGAGIPSPTSFDHQAPEPAETVSLGGYRPVAPRCPFGFDNPESQASPGTPNFDWKDVVPTRAEQDRWNSEITDIQKTLAAGNANLEGMDRGFHQKQLYGGLATVKVREDIPDFLKFGPFAPDKEGHPQALQAAVRFSNGQGCPFKDSSPDVRGIAVKMAVPGEGGKAEAWDILATNKQTFARDPEQFMKFAKINAVSQTWADNLPGLLGFALGQAAAGIALTAELIESKFNGLVSLFPGRESVPRENDWDVTESARVGAALVKDTVLYKTRSLATEAYDGGTFKLPSGELAKILFVPEEGAKAKKVSRKDPDYLGTELQKQLEDGPVKFTMQVKVYTGNGEPEKAHDDWEPAAVYSVADLEIPKGDSAIGDKVNSMAFNPANGFEPAYMTHARKEIYETSAKNRGAMGQDEALALLAKGATDGPS